MKIKNCKLQLCSAWVASALSLQSVAAHSLENEAVEKGPSVEVCFVLDTTGSMKGMIEGAKRKIWTIANEISASDPEPRSIRFALVGYRDRSDAYVTKTTALTDDLDSIHSQLMSFQAAGGGDHPESVNQALNEALTTLQWSEEKNVSRLVFLVGDAPPHMDYQDDVKYMTTGKIAQRKGVTINSILCGSNEQAMKHWKKICALTQGSFAQIEQSGGTQVVSCPQDEKIKALTLKLNGTVYLYGDKKQQALGWSKLNAVAESSLEANASRACYQTNNFAGKVMSGNEDLVDEWKTGNVKLDEIEKDKLPSELAELSSEDLEKKLKIKVAEREEIQKELDALNKTRSEYLKEQAKKAPKGAKEAAFDKAIEGILKKQIRKR